MTNRKSFRALVLAMALLLPGIVHAHTSMYGGYILEIRPADSGPKSGLGTLVVLRTWDSDSRDDAVHTVSITAQYVCILDGRCICGDANMWPCAG